MRGLLALLVGGADEPAGLRRVRGWACSVMGVDTVAAGWGNQVIVNPSRWGSH